MSDGVNDRVVRDGVPSAAEDEESARLRRRVERALRGTTIEQVVNFARVRAIVGARRHEGEMPELAITAYAKLRNGFPPPTASELAAIEAVVRAFRPVMLFAAGRPSPLPDDTDAAFGRAWGAFADRVGPVAYSIGRVDFVRRLNPIQTEAIGTGFLVGERALMTNRHVVLQLTRGTLHLDPGQALVRFRYEFGTADREVVGINRVVVVHPTLDLALLELAEDGGPPLEIDTRRVAEGDAAVVIGYPTADARNAGFSSLLLGSAEGVKRAAPGEVLSGDERALFHDCSTLGGNSGSPVLSMSSARVLGVHRDGYFLDRNEAVAAPALREFVDQHVGRRP